MQLVARVEKLTPPKTADVCAAAALAVVALLENEQAAPGGEWEASIEAWQGGGRIRKLVRRARGAAWERAQEPAGASATVGDAQVRAYVPSRMDAVPDAVRKLQIQSTPLDEPQQLASIPEGFSVQSGPSNAGGAAPRMLIVVTPRVEMSWGKQAAQCAHAGQVLWREASADVRQAWVDGGRQVEVVHAVESWWEAAVERADITIRDGGFTEIPAGTMSSVAWFL